MATRRKEDKPNDLHPWVKMTQARLEKATPDTHDGLLHPGKINQLSVVVSKESITRSMVIWDRLLKVMEKNGFKVRMQQEYPGRTIATVDGEDVSIRLREKVHRQAHTPTPEEKERAKGYTNLFQPPAWERVPTGKLVLVVEYQNVNRVYVEGFTWEDSGKKRIEDRLDSFVQAVLDLAASIKEDRKEAEEQERKWKEEAQRKQEVANRHAEEKKVREDLERLASSWQLACSIRQFVEAVREEATRRIGKIEDGSSLDQWLRWAEQHASRIDPVNALLAGVASSGNGK